ncbi:MAG TPA: hypothetical protein VKK31_21015 [Thermoanaerobaculia bacterium]|nr:hypothetical protein [Thermoanaerobaculia bacterium]
MRITPTNSFLAALLATAVLTGCGSSGIGDVLGGPRTSGGSNDRYDPYDQSAGDLQGTVNRVDSRNRLIYVDSEGTDSRYNLRNGNGGEIALYYDDQTRVEHQGRTYRPEDLERGDRIRADVEGTGDRLVAQQIEVLYDVTSGGSGSAQDQDDYRDDRDDRDYRDLRGTVRSVDTRDRTLELETSRYGSGFAPEGSSSNDRYNSNDVVLVQYDAQTIVEFEGQRYKPENLERGDVVEVQVRDLGGRRLAERITVVGENQPVGR